MKFVDPASLFFTEPPVVPIVADNLYYDRTEIGMTNYLQILPSVALYGFKYVVYIDSTNKILDGNFRAYAALELGLKVPCSIQKWCHVYPVWLVRIIRRFRLLFQRNWLFYKKFTTDSIVSTKSLVMLSQKNILGD